MKKRLLSLALVLCMVFALLPLSAFAADGDVVYLGFTSDIHNTASNTSADRLGAWLTNVSAALGDIVFADFGSCGDMGSASTSESNYWKFTEADINAIRNSGKVSGSGFFVCGNHEWYPGNFGGTSSQVKAEFTVIGGKTETESYILYSMGAASSSQGFSSNDISNLDNYLKTATASKPVIILAHFPLHSEGGRSTSNAASLIKTLNEYGYDRTIIYLWGHNHTLSDSHYDNVYTDKLDSTDISFVYASAGCMSDSEYGSGSAYVDGKGLVIGLDSEHAYLTYYDENGAAVGGTTAVELAEAHTHTAGAAVRENVRAAACTQKGGYEEVTYCTVCKKELSRVSVETDALGHDPVHHDGRSANCTEVGWNAYDTCSRCSYSTYAEIPALGHNFVNGECSRCHTEQPAPTMSILTPSTTKVKYGDTLILHAYVENMPAGARVEWSVSGSGAQITPSADSYTCAVKCTATGTVTVTARLVLNDGTPVTGDNGALFADQTLTMDGSGWNKFVSFFKDLFGVNRVTERSR